MSAWAAQLRQKGAPVTLGFLALLVISFGAHLALAGAPMPWLALDRSTIASRPWTLFTYPFAMSPDLNKELIAVAFGGFWLWGFGPPVERELGSRRYFAFLAILTAIAGAMFLAACAAYQARLVLTGAWIVIPSVCIAWAARRPNEIVRLMFALPFPAKWVAWLSAILVLLAAPPAFAPFLVAPLLLVYFFAADRLPWKYGAQPATAKATRSRSGLPTDDRFLSEVRRREKEREEKERLRKLFESQMIDNTDDKP